MNGKRGLVLFLSCLLVILIGAAAILGIIMFNNNGDDSKFRKHISEGNKYIAEENWDAAIASYLEAIEYNDMDEDAYYTLAEIYIYLDRMNDAKDILVEGIERTNSNKLQELYDKHFKEVNASVNINNEKSEEATLAINTTILNNIASYKFEKYSSKYGTAKTSMNGDNCEVVHKNLEGATFIYYDIEINENIVDEENDRPYDNVMPCEVTFEKVTSIISGFDGTVSYEELSALPVKSISKGQDYATSKEVVSFEVAKCIIYLECDANGNVSEDAWNKVVPKYGNEESEDTTGEVFEVGGNVINAVTGTGVADATITVRDRGVTSGEAIVTVETQSDGSYVLELPEGQYTAEIECDDFITEDIDFEVDKWGESDLGQFVISQELEEGQIRVVLEWSAYPSDLDSHLRGTTSNGNDIHVSYMDQEEEGANLDVDDRNGYGPETVTIFDISGEYEYFVHDYTRSGNIADSSATVKVYTPGRDNPYEYEIPAEVDGDYWYVFRIKDGEVVDY